MKQIPGILVTVLQSCTGKHYVYNNNKHHFAMRNLYDIYLYIMSGLNRLESRQYRNVTVSQCDAKEKNDADFLSDGQMIFDFHRNPSISIFSSCSVGEFSCCALSSFAREKAIFLWRGNNMAFKLGARLMLSWHKGMYSVRLDFGSQFHEKRHQNRLQHVERMTADAH